MDLQDNPNPWRRYLSGIWLVTTFQSSHRLEINIDTPFGSRTVKCYPKSHPLTWRDSTGIRGIRRSFHPRKLQSIPTRKNMGPRNQIRRRSTHFHLGKSLSIDTRENEKLSSFPWWELGHRANRRIQFSNYFLLLFHPKGRRYSQTSNGLPKG